MKNIIHYILFLFAFISVWLLSSCQKDLSIENGIRLTPVTPNNILGDSAYLDKIFMIDSSGANLDSSYLVFNYDGQKRINNIVLKELPNSTDSTFWLKFFYTGNDSLPYLVKHELDPSDYYCYYNSAGQLMRDSVLNYGTNEISVAHLNYNGNKVYIDISRSTTGASNLTPVDKDTFSLDTRGNVIQSDSYFKDFFTGNYNLSNKTISTFDNYLTPYTKVIGFKMFMFAYNIPFENFDNVFTTNNQITNTDSYYTTAGSVTTLFDTRVVSYSNTYYINGFLKNAVSITSGPNNSGYSNWTYFYKSL